VFSPSEDSGHCIACGTHDHLNSLGLKERIGLDDQRTGARSHDGGKSGIQIVVTHGTKNFDLLPSIHDRTALVQGILSLCHASKERVRLIGTDQRITSGPAARTAAIRGRIHGRNHRHRWLLRARRDRPRGSRATEQRDELASSDVGHGLLPGTRCASLAHALSATARVTEKHAL
jgi:hypothetical protein